MAGAIMQWLRDGLNMVRDSSETEALAVAADPDNEVVLIPAFTGLGAPHWRPEACAAIMGLTRNAGKAEIAHAALQAVSLQTEDLLIAMRSDMSKQSFSSPSHLRVDGGMVNNNWFVQNLSDITNIPIDRPVTVETTALGVAYLAGLQRGIFSKLEDITEKWQLDRSFIPQMPVNRRERILSRWSGAISKILHDVS
jgi:glycerol kinase